MKTWFSLVALVAVFGVVLALASPVVPTERSSPFDGLRAGDPVTVKGTAPGEQGQYTITYGLPKSHTHTIVHVGKDFVVLKDLIGVMEYSIPITSVRAVIKMNIQK